MEKIPVPSNFEEQFDPQKYLRQYYNTPGTAENRFRDLCLERSHDLFTDLFPLCGTGATSSESFKVLDYGSGPVVAYVISAAGKERVSEIVLAAHTSKNREAIQLWLAKDPSAFDWSPYFKYVVQNLEGKLDSDVTAREERLRSLVKVTSCDIRDNPPIGKGYEGPYNVVMSFLSIQNACQNESEYFTFLKKLSGLIKPGGCLLLFAKLSSVSQQMYYPVGSEDIYYNALSCETVQNALEKASFTSVTTTPFSATGESISDSMISGFAPDTLYYMFFRATK